MPKQENKLLDILAWIVQVSIACLMFMPMFNKFIATPASVFIFDRLGGGDSALYGTAICEALIILMLLIPATRLAGLFCAAFTMISAIVCHLTYVGVEVYSNGEGDGGTMFAMACMILGLSLFGMLLRGKEFYDFYLIAMGYQEADQGPAAEAH